MIDRKFLLAKLTATPRIADTVGALDNQTACFCAPTVAQRLREDAFSALVTVAGGGDLALDPAVLGEIFAASFATNLMLDWTKGVPIFSGEMPSRFSRFLAIQDSARDIDGMHSDIAFISQQLNLSARSIQYACSRESMLGFGAYLRLLRLHAARRALRDPSNLNRSIGDVIFEFGFLDWSHFGEQYRQTFGERPSDTRQRLA